MRYLYFVIAHNTSPTEVIETICNKYLRQSLLVTLRGNPSLAHPL